MEPPSSSNKVFTQFAAPVTLQQSRSANVVRRGHDEIAARRLQIYAFDPQLGRRRRYRIPLEIPYERLDRVGSDISRPSGRVVNIVDYDAASDRYYTLVNLDHPRRPGQWRTPAPGRRSRVPSADGLRGDDESRSQLRAGSGTVKVGDRRRQRHRGQPGAELDQDQGDDDSDLRRRLSTYRVLSDKRLI